jgi:imidazolonepropionase
MWDRLLTDCNVCTMVPTRGDPLGIVRNAAIAISDGRIVRLGKRTDMAGMKVGEIVPMKGLWVTPGLIDCHTHLIFGGTRAREHALRRMGASYEEIAKAGGGIASTIAATAAASDDELLRSARRRLHALMAGGCTTVEIKSGYGSDVASELRLLRIAQQLATSEPVRIAPTLLALHALPKGADRKAFVAQAIDELVPAVADAQLATSVDGFCEGIGFLPHEIEQLFVAADNHGLRVKLHAEQLSNRGGAKLAARYRALSADHLEHLDALGAEAMAEAGTVAVLLPGAFYTLAEKQKPPVQLLRDHGVPIAIATDCNPGTSPLLNPQLAMNMACTLFGLTPEEALAGMTVNAAQALGIDDQVGTLAPGKVADLVAWDIDEPAELGYWMGMLGPERRMLAGEDC